MTRRKWMLGLGAAAAGCGRGGWRLSSFEADVTPPLGHPLLAGTIAPAREVLDPLSARGIVLTGGGPAVVLVAVDWCEIRNAAHERWRTVLAEAAGTTAGRVLVTTLHQHDTPVMDTGAQRILDQAGVTGGRLCDPVFHEQALGRVAGALRRSLTGAQPVTHVGTGLGEVRDLACNRRAEFPGGTVNFDRSAIVTDPAIQALEPGLIDPWLRMLTFWNGDRPLCAVSVFAVHPITTYGKGGVSADFAGAARALWQKARPDVPHVYCTGVAGDVTAGKYTDGSLHHRPVLAERLYSGMEAAWTATQRARLERVESRAVPLPLTPRIEPGFTTEDFRREIADPAVPFSTKALNAMGLSWGGRPLDLPVVDFGPVRMLLMPGETFLQYQLWAQAMRPDLFVIALGYGDGAPGYVPTVTATEEGFDRRKRSIKTWMWCDPWKSEAVLRGAVEHALDRRSP
ncbi:MAG: hypothetical protein IPM24_14605 [Bryobacterales bacterium]|nr:hypothetical protein [Bryobacterales bacterium]